MREPKSSKGARALLFERLVDLDPNSRKEEPQPVRVLNREELKESVRRELERLLNTRSSTPTPLFGVEELTVLDYGIPDFSSFSAHNADDHRRIEAIIKRSISAFEPRLQGVQVTVEQSRDSADHHHRIANFMKRSLLTFEPHLQWGQEERFRDSNWSLWVRIDASLVFDSLTETVSFPALIQSKTGRAEVQ